MLNHNIINLLINKCDIEVLGRLTQVSKLCNQIVNDMFSDVNSDEFHKLVIIKSIHNVDNGLQSASKMGFMDLIDYYLKRGATEYISSIYLAAQYGQRKVIDLFMKRQIVDVNMLLYHAAFGGQKDMIEYLIKKHGANDWNLGYKGAMEGSKIELKNYFTNKSKAQCAMFMPYQPIMRRKRNKIFYSF